MQLRRVLSIEALACLGVALLTACAPLAPSRLSVQAEQTLRASPLPDRLTDLQRQQWLDRVSWGATDHEAAQLQQQGLKRWLSAQLTASAQPMPAEAQRRFFA